MRIDVSTTRKRQQAIVQATPREGDQNRHWMFRHDAVSPRCPCGEHHASSVHRPTGGRTYARALRERE